MRRKVIIEDFGKIKHVELEMKPMMMFVGDNNSGKSYLMSLLWGLSSESNDILTRLNEKVKRLKLYEECKKYVSEVLHLRKKEEPLSRFWIDKFWDLLNCCIEQNKDQFVSDIFNKDVQIGKLDLRIKGEIHVSISIEEELLIIESGKMQKREDEKADFVINSNIVWFNVQDDLKAGMRVEEWENSSEEFLEVILKALLRYWRRSYQIGINNIFLPSSRTGFVLSKNIMINNMYESSFNRVSGLLQEEQRDIQSSYFTKPVISFLKLLNEIGTAESKNEKLNELAKIIEQLVLHGQVVIQDTTSRAFLYKPENMDDSIQMYLASSVVTEITPLYLLCKYQHMISQMFIEEPEMCLHPQLQTAVAKVLVRMCNMKIPVIMTTHSDIIIQHINNMLRVNNSDKKQGLMEKFQIEEQDLLKEDQVGVYQFTCQRDGSSRIEELKARAMGFETTTFSNAFEEMLELTYDI